MGLAFQVLFLLSDNAGNLPLTRKVDRPQGETEGERTAACSGIFVSIPISPLRVLFPDYIKLKAESLPVATGGSGREKSPIPRKISLANEKTGVGHS